MQLKHIKAVLSHLWAFVSGAFSVLLVGELTRDHPNMLGLGVLCAFYLGVSLWALSFYRRL